MSMNHHLPKKIDLKPKAHHGFYGVLVICGFFLPPLAVALRFGIGKDFFINCFLVICGYIPSHFHNFYIQNIRNNTGRNRTPKWAKRYGLVDDSDDKRKARKSQWAKRYNERNPHSTLEGAELAEGEEGENYTPEGVITEEERARRQRAGLWSAEDEEFYNEDRNAREASNQRHWHYPANFEGTDVDNDADRWDRTRAAYDDVPAQSAPKGIFGRKSKKSDNSRIAAYAPQGNGYDASSNPMDAAYDDDVPEWGRDYGAPKSSKLNSSSRRGRSGTTGSSAYGNGYGNGYGNANGNGNANKTASVGGNRSEAQENWDHQF